MTLLLFIVGVAEPEGLSPSAKLTYPNYRRQLQILYLHVVLNHLRIPLLYTATNSLMKGKFWNFQMDFCMTFTISWRFLDISGLYSRHGIGSSARWRPFSKYIGVNTRDHLLQCIPGCFLLGSPIKIHVSTSSADRGTLLEVLLSFSDTNFRVVISG